MVWYDGMVYFSQRVMHNRLVTREQVSPGFARFARSCQVM